MNYKSVIITIALLGTGLTAGAQDSGGNTKDTNPHTTVARKHVEPLVTTKIKLLTRTYGDSIVLRWLAEDFASWQYLCDVGVNVLRVPRSEDGGFQVDTLAYALKPLSQEKFQQRFPASDTLAYVPQGVLYGDAENVKTEARGSMGRTMEYNNEQDLSYAFAMLIAEWRPDLAEAMAVRFTDRTAKPGAVYDYYIQPTVWENGGMLIFEPGVAERVENKPYTPEDYQPLVKDTVGTPRRVTLQWNDGHHSSFEVERRTVGDTQGTDGETTWQRITTKPYVSMLDQPDNSNICLLVDSVPAFGVYEYRIMGYDAFGELTPPSPAFSVNVYDNEAPTPPQIKNIIIDYPDNDVRGRKRAHFVWQKESMESDLQGYTIEYMNNQMTGRNWHTLTDELIAPTDTIYSLDVTNLRTGFVSMVAYDESGNSSRSMTQLLQILDYKAPDAPYGLKATVAPVETDSIESTKDAYGYVMLAWQSTPEDDDIMYFDVAFANDSLHTFQIRNNGGITEHNFLDSLALDVNQKYIYYKVRAVDYSTNIGPWSRWIQVERPHVTPPTQPHLDTSKHDDEKGIHMEWIVGMDADMKYHVAYRCVDENGVWEEIGRYDADSLAKNGYRIVIDDNPAYNREQRYYYYVESFNSSPYTSKSLAVSWFHKGPKVWEVPIELVGDYMEKENRTRLVWQPGKLPFDAPYYWCIYRKGQGDDKFQFVISQPAKETEYVDKMLQEGEQAEYYVMIQWRDGRQSTISNVIKVKRK